MCGRYSVTSDPEALRRLFDYPEQPNFPPRYNIAPTQPVPVVRLSEGGRHFALMRWSFVPGWVKDPKDFPLVINMRAETVREKPAFRSAFLRRRALMPADAFYEWRRDGGAGKGKASTPYMIARADRAPFAFAALWEAWTGPNGEEVEGCGIITCEAGPPLTAIHHRTPVVLDPRDWDAWLDPASEPASLGALLVAPPESVLALTPIGPAVNKVAYDGPDLQRPVAEAEPPAPVPAPRARRAGGDGQGSLF